MTGTYTSPKRVERDGRLVAFEGEVGGTLCFVLQEHGEVAACISLGVKATGEDEHDHQEDVSVWFHINTC